MPYVRKGKTIYKREGGQLRKKQTAKTEENAKRAMRLLQGLEHGWKPRRKNG